MKKKDKSYEDMTIAELMEEEKIHVNAIKEIYKLYSKIGVKQTNLINELLNLAPHQNNNLPPNLSYQNSSLNDLVPRSLEKPEQSFNETDIAMSVAVPIMADEQIESERADLINDIKNSD